MHYLLDKTKIENNLTLFFLKRYAARKLKIGVKQHTCFISCYVGVKQHTCFISCYAYMRSAVYITSPLLSLDNINNNKFIYGN